MTIRTIYHSGGFVAAAPVQNVAERWDNTANTYTRWNTAGAQQEQRALTADEAARMAEADTADQTGFNSRDMRQKLETALGINATYAAVANPTAAQNLAQIRALTKECNSLIRLQMDLLGDTTGT